MSNPLTSDVLRVAKAIEGVLAVSASNFPAKTEVRIMVLGDNTASITIPEYLLGHLIRAAREHLAEHSDVR